MMILALTIDEINDSLQVGDLIFSCPTDIQAGSNDPQHYDATSTTLSSGGVGEPNIVGVLRKIQKSGNGTYWFLWVDGSNYPSQGDYLMFSKFAQGDSGVLGYYATTKLENNSREKAELFAVSSEVIINSK